MVRIALKRGWSCRCGPVDGSFVTGMEGMIRPARTWSAVSCVTWDTGGSRCRGGDTSRQVRRSSAGSAWLGRARAPLWVSLAFSPACPTLLGAVFSRCPGRRSHSTPVHPRSPERLEAAPIRGHPIELHTWPSFRSGRRMPTRRAMAASSRKMKTPSVPRLISPLRRSSGLVACSSAGWGGRSSSRHSRRRCAHRPPVPSAARRQGRSCRAADRYRHSCPAARSGS